MGHDDDVPTGTRWALLRLSIIGHLLASPPEPGALGGVLDALALRSWTHPRTREPVRFGRSTIERWFYAAKNARDPVATLARKAHGQRGQHPSMTSAVRCELFGLYAAHRSWSRQLLYDNLAVLAEDKPELSTLPSYATVCRVLRDAGKERCPRPRRERPGEAVSQAAFEARETRSYEASHVHGLWHADYHDGSRKVLAQSGQWIIPQLLCVLDDRSRLACHAQWYATEDARTYVHGLMQAFGKRGLPREFMSDLGGPMKAAETLRGLERLGVTWSPTLPYSPEQNGKQEVFWTQVEGRLLPMLDDVCELTLERLNVATMAWVELEYNRKVHSETGQKPLDRFLAGPSVGRDSPRSDGLRDAFRQRVTRTVRRSDGTLTVKGIRYEVPSRYRHLRAVGVLFARWDLARVDMTGVREEEPLCRLYPIDKEKNADGLRRLHARPADAERSPEPPSAEEEAPLLRKLLSEYAATGFPPAYVTEERWPEDTECDATTTEDEETEHDEKGEDAS